MQPSTSHVLVLRPLLHRLCAHAAPRRVQSTLGGYRESFGFYGEEKEFCLRLIDAGYRTVYLPDALVMHEPDPGGRSQQPLSAQRDARTTASTRSTTSRWHRARLGAAGAAVSVLPYAPRRGRSDDPWGWAWVAATVGRQCGIGRARAPPGLAQTRDVWKRLQARRRLSRAPGAPALERPWRD